MYFTFKTIASLHHPLILATSALITGIFLFTCQNGYACIFSCIIGLGLLIIHFFVRPVPLFYIIIAISFFVIGYCRTYFYYQTYDSFVQSLSHKKVNIRGSIIDIDSIDHPYFDTCILFSLHAIQQNKAWKPLYKTIQIYTKKSRLFSVDDSLIVRHIQLSTPQKDSFKFYLMKEGIDATCFIPTLPYTLLKRPYYSLNRFLNIHKIRIGTVCSKKLSPYTYALFSSLFLGYKKKCKEELAYINEQFKQWGILHYLARSGLHLVIFIFIWQTLLRAIPLSLRAKNIIMLLLGILYFVLTWPSISFVRAFIIFLLYKVCSFAHVQSSLIHLLALCCLSILLYNPLQLFALDFQLSFILTFALAWSSLAYPNH